MKFPPLQQAPFADRYNFGCWLNGKGLIDEAAEIGTHRGDFARRLMFTWMGWKLHCIDPWVGGYDDSDPASNGDREEDLAVAVETLKPYEDRVKLWRTSSNQAASCFKDNQLGFVYVDGCHKHDAVAQDLRLWWPKLHPGGVLAGHDLLELGVDRSQTVQRAVMEFAAEHGLTVFLVTEPSLAAWSWYVEKPK